jgi:uncharacterized protein
MDNGRRTRERREHRDGMERKALGSQMEIGDIKKDLFSVFDKYKESLVFAYLFGSATQKDGYPPSDIDIAVFVRVEQIQSHFELKLSLHADISRALKKKRIDLIVLNSTTNLLLLDEILRKGILLIDQDRELREEFELEVLHQATAFKEQRFTTMGL